jgi:regulatory protein
LTEQFDAKLVQRAKNILLHQLSRSMKTRHQLNQTLEKREIPAQLAAVVLDRFEEAELINDAAFAVAYVNSKLAAGGKSAAALRRELKTKGVADHLIAAALSDLDQEAELKVATALARKRLARMSSLEPEISRRRLMGYLARRGFGTSVITAAMRAAKSSE